MQAVARGEVEHDPQEEDSDADDYDPTQEEGGLSMGKCWSPVHLVEKLLHVVHHNSNEDDDDDDEEEARNAASRRPRHHRQERSLLNHHPQLQPHHLPILITLYFDSSNCQTIACLSRPCPVLQVYLQCRVAQNTAQARSPLYFQLDGYARPNWVQIQRQYQGFAANESSSTSLTVEPGSSRAPRTPITLALGALRDSDLAQQQEQAHQMKVSVARKHQRSCSLQLFQQAMQICVLARLEDDLDVVSLDCWRRASTLCAQLAQPILEKRLSHALWAVPYVDGGVCAGQSRFVRKNGTNNDNDNNANANNSGHLVRIPSTQAGGGQRLVEYQRCPAIPLTTANKPQCTPTTLTTCATPSSSGTFQVGVFQWNCQEIALQNLRRWNVVWDYVGQKVCLHWKPGAADAHLLSMPRSKTNTSESNRHNDMDKEESHLPLATFRLDAYPAPGAAQWVEAGGDSGAKAQFSISHSVCQTSPDNVTTRYQGQARLVQVQFEWKTLVRTCARKALEQWNHNVRNNSKRWEQRPLWEHELRYWQVLREQAAASPPTTRETSSM